VDDLVPVGFQLRRDPGTRLIVGGSRLGGGAVLVGGSPTRVLRLTASGARQVADWLEDKPVGDGVAARQLARKLLDAGIVHPGPGVSRASQDVITARSGATDGDPTLTHADVTLAHADVTVVIPVKDRQDELARCLAGLADTAGSGSAGESPSEGGWRRAASPLGAVIVVDDCSADPAATVAIAAAAGARVIRRPVNGGPGAARNTGLAAATTELVAFLDSDCVPAAGWLDAILPHFADPVVGAVAPRIVPHEPARTSAGRGWIARYEGVSSTLDMGARPSIVRPGARVPYVPGAALVVRRAAAGDGFTPGMRVGEDVDFAWRLAAAGWRVRYEPAAVMGHQHRVRLRPWMSRRADYGTSAAHLEELHPGSVRPLYASWWTLAAWGAALAVRPRWAGVAVAAGVTGVATAMLARRLSTVTGEGWPLPGQRAGVPGAAGDGRSAGGGSAGPAGSGWAAWRLAARLAGGGTLAAGRPLGSAISRTWWPAVIPLAVAVPRLRLPVAALLVAPPLLDWADRRPPLGPVRYMAARLLDDAAYSCGVWQGCVRRRSLRAVLPVVTGRAGSGRGTGTLRPGSTPGPASP
jgi:mycofactocin system glycosyltransferase